MRPVAGTPARGRDHRRIDITLRAAGFAAHGEEFHALLASANIRETSRSLGPGGATGQMIYLAGDTGMRPGEYLALPRFNVSREEVKVDRAVERSGHKISVTETPAGWRWIDLSPETAGHGHPLCGQACAIEQV